MAAMQKLKFVLIVFLAGGIVVLPNGVDAIKCYKCDNHNGPRAVELLCDPVSPTDKGRITECDSGVCLQTSWLGQKPGLPCDGCIYRMCGHAGTPSGCTKREAVDARGNIPFVMNECHCNTELCNNFDPFSSEERKKSDHVLEKPYKAHPENRAAGPGAPGGSMPNAIRGDPTCQFVAFVISIIGVFCLALPFDLGNH